MESTNLQSVMDACSMNQSLFTISSKYSSHFTNFCLADLSMIENILIIHYNGNFYQFLPVVLLFIYPETILLGTYNLEL